MQYLILTKKINTRFDFVFKKEFKIRSYLFKTKSDLTDFLETRSKKSDNTLSRHIYKRKLRKRNAMYLG